jgi:hypothetical protein
MRKIKAAPRKGAAKTQASRRKYKYGSLPIIVIAVLDKLQRLIPSGFLAHNVTSLACSSASSQRKSLSQ